MNRKLVVEGLVKEEDGMGPFIHTRPPKKAGQMTGYRGEDLLEEFIGKRVRVTVEIIKSKNRE